MHVIVTGGASGIGRASALRLSRRMKVSIADLDMDGAQQTVEMIRAQGGEAQAIECDVSNRASVFSMADQARQTFGAVDCLFANAGINYSIPNKFSPYIGVNWDRKVGQTATIAKNNGESVSAVSFVAGARLFW